MHINRKSDISFWRSSLLCELGFLHPKGPYLFPSRGRVGESGPFYIMPCITVPRVTTEKWQLGSVVHLTGKATFSAAPPLVIQFPLHATCHQTWGLQVRRLFLNYARMLSHCSQAKPYARMYRSRGTSSLTTCCSWMLFFINSRCWHCSLSSRTDPSFLLGDFYLGVFEILSFQWTSCGTITILQRGSGYMKFQKGRKCNLMVFLPWSILHSQPISSWCSALHSKG